MKKIGLEAYSTGMKYYEGNGVPKDYKMAVYYFKKAAKHGNTDAQNMLGMCYKFGNGVKKDTKKAESWFKKAKKSTLVFSTASLKPVDMYKGSPSDVANNFKSMSKIWSKYQSHQLNHQ